MSQSAIFFVIFILFEVFYLRSTCCGLIEGNVGVLPNTSFFLKNLSKELNSKLSPEVDPCEDYFKYVCGRTNLRRYYKDDEVDGRDFLQNYLPSLEEMSDAERKLKIYLTSCTDRQDHDLEQFLKTFNSVNFTGQWPIFDSNWTADKFDFQTAIAVMSSFNILVVIDISYETDLQTFKPFLSISPTKSDLFKSPIRLTRLTEKMIELGISNIDEIINDGLQFEKQFEDILKLFKEREDEDVKTNLSGLKAEISEIDWKKQIEIISGTKLLDNHEVVVNNIEALKETIRAVSTMDTKVVANYIFCNFVSFLPSSKLHWDHQMCFDYITKTFPLISAGVFARRFLVGDYKEKLFGMLSSVLKNLNEYLDIFEGANEYETEDKINNFLTNEYLSMVGDEHLTKIYENYHVNPNSFTENVFNLRRFAKRKSFTNSFTGKNHKLEILKRTLPLALSYNLYKVRYMPSSAVYDTLSLELVATMIRTTKNINSISNSTRECFDRQLKSQSLSQHEYLSFLKFIIYSKGFIDWADRSEVTKEEDDVLGEFGLTNRKIILLNYMRFGCAENDLASRERMLSFYWNFDKFGEIYNCPVGAPMNPEEKCHFV